MSSRLNNPPVYCVLAQVTFNPIMALDNYVSAIQEGFRTADFPDVQTNTVNNVSINLDDGGGQIRQEPVKQYSFGDLERQNSFILAANSLTYITSKHDVFESLLEALIRGLRVVDDAVNLSFVERIGLRYVNAIMADQSNNSPHLSQLLEPAAFGFSGKVSGQIVRTYCETHMRSGEIQSVTKVLSHGRKFESPPDLTQLPVNFDNPINEYDGPHAVLDIDSFVQNRMKFDLGVIESLFVSSHDLCEESFKAVTTNAAREYWNR